MRVIIHCGLNKTGSTTIQRIFSEKFYPEALERVCYPYPHTDRGNAGRLLDCMRSNDDEGVNIEYKRLRQQADRHQVLFLSCESIYHTYVTKQGRNILNRLQNNNPQDEIEFIFFFRNLYDHARSCYAHRCGDHSMPDFKKWIQADSRAGKKGIDYYEFWSEMLLGTVAFKDRRFKKSIFSFEKHGFPVSKLGEFLGYDLTKLSRRENVSVNLAEAELLRFFRKKFGRKISMRLRENLKKLSPNRKASDRKINYKYNELVSKVIDQKMRAIGKFENELGFAISSRPHLDDKYNNEQSLSFTMPQLAAIMRSLKYGKF